MTKQLAIDQTDSAFAGALPHATQQEISHSPLLYWWPPWTFGFLLPFLNAGQEKFLATGPGAKPSSGLGFTERTEIVEPDLEAANARTELAERERQALAAELEAAQAREQAAKEMAQRDSQRQAADLEAANARTELAERERQALAAELEAAQAREQAAKEMAQRDSQRQAADLEEANARTELAERECQALAAELEAAQAHGQAAKQIAEAARDREQAVLATAEGARVRELAANAVAEESRRVARRTKAELAAALLLALIAFATGIYKSWELAQLKGHQGSVNALQTGELGITTARTGGPHISRVPHVR